MKERVMAEVKDTFRPEFINRIDDLIVFHALEPDDIRRIAGLMLGSVSKRLAQRGHEAQLRRRRNRPAGGGGL